MIYDLLDVASCHIRAIHALQFTPLSLQINSLHFLVAAIKQQKIQGSVTIQTRDTVLVEHKPPPIIDYAVCIIFKHSLASFP